MGKIILVGFLCLLIPISTVVNAERIIHSNVIEVTPSEYGKYGITPFVGPVSGDGTQETTLVFDKSIQGRDLSQVKLLFFSSKKILILASDNKFECKNEKCFVTLGIIPDYQYNLEFELVYDVNEVEEKSGFKPIRYRIKDIGMLTGRFNRTH